MNTSLPLSGSRRNTAVCAARSFHANSLLFFAQKILRNRAEQGRALHRSNGVA